MTPVEIIAECARRGIELRATTDRIEWRPADAGADDLFDALAAQRREVAAELHRDAAITDAWERLRVLYVEHGAPDDWITGDVRTAEHAVNELWVAARAKPAGDRGFDEALRRWEQLAVEAIIQAAGIVDDRRT